MRAKARWFAGAFAVFAVWAVWVVTPALATPAAWVLYTHPDKRMSARFPDKPHEVEQETPSPVGNIHFKVAAFSDANRTYLATAAVYPESARLNVKAAIEDARDRVLANIKGKIVSEKPMKLDGFEGREVWFEASRSDTKRQVRGILRVFASAKPPSAFLASAMQMTETPDPDQERFLASIHLGAKVETTP